MRIGRGSIRYTGGDFEFCRDGVTWQTLASVADSAAPDTDCKRDDDAGGDECDGV